jgi:hypothetical protein
VWPGGPHVRHGPEGRAIFTCNRPVLVQLMALIAF